MIASSGRVLSGNTGRHFDHDRVIILDCGVVMRISIEVIMEGALDLADLLYSRLLQLVRSHH